MSKKKRSDDTWFFLENHRRCAPLSRFLTRESVLNLQGYRFQQYIDKIVGVWGLLSIISMRDTQSYVN